MYLTTVRGLPVRLHYTWLLVLLLGLPILSRVTLPGYLPELGGLATIALALLILALFFGVVVVHELAHLLVARLLRVPFPVMNLYPLGAVTRLPDRHGRPSAAFWTAAAGPIASIALWWVLAGAADTLAVSGAPAIVLSIVGTLSLYLGLVNLVPALPLDGGRMLRAILWWANGIFEPAQRIARLVGQIIAYGMVFSGIGLVIGPQDWLRGGGLVLIGWAIREAGGTARRRRLVTQLLNRLTAADVLSAPARVVAPERSLREFAALLRGRMGTMPTPVIADDMFLGMIDRELLRDVPQGYWDERTVAETMLPAAHIGSISPATPVSTLLPRLLTDALWQRMPMPVVDQGRLVGLIDSDQMSEILELEDEFGLFGRGAVAEARADARAAPTTGASASGAAPQMAQVGADSRHERAVGL
jgi:Zn-dependent protease